MILKTLLLGAIATTAVASTAMADGHEGERARDGEVKIIYWQAPSILNPYLSGGTKDIESSSLLSSQWAATTKMVTWCHIWQQKSQQLQTVVFPRI